MVDTEKRKEANKKIAITAAILWLLFGWIFILEDTPKAEEPENPPAEEQIAEELPLLKYEVVKIEELQKKQAKYKGSYQRKADGRKIG